MKKITILSLLFITVFSVGAVLAHEYVAEGEYTTEVEFVNSANIDYSAVKKKGNL